MNNSEKLYIAKEAGNLRAMLSRAGRVVAGRGKTLASKVKNSPLLGSRGQTGQITTQAGAPGNPFITRSLSPPGKETLWGAKGLKGIFRPKLKQLEKPPTLHGGHAAGDPLREGGFGFTDIARNKMVDTPLAKLLQAVTIGGGGGGLAYAGYKGLEADDNLGPPYNYKRNPNENLLGDPELE